MEDKHIRENLINLIKKFNNSCSECGKIFLGALLEGSTEVGAYPVYVGITSYPLSCGKCPECAKKCYENLFEYIETNNKVPCNDSIIDEDEYFEDIIPELDCWMYIDEDFQMDQLGAGNPNVEGGELIDLFDFIEEEIININTEKEYKRKHQLIKNLEEEDRNQSSELLLEFLEDEDPRIRMEAISILGNNDNLQINEKLLLFLKDENPSVRIKVVEVLGKKDDTQIIEKLVELLKDPNSGVREKLVEILGKQKNPQILQVILDLINDDSHIVRRKVIEVFRSIDNPQVFQKVFDQLKNENQEISKAIEDILKGNNSQTVIEKLIEMLKSDNDKDWIKALEILSTKRRSNYLIEKLNVILDIIFDRLNFEEVAQFKYLTMIFNIDKSATLMYLIEQYKNNPQEIQLKILEIIEKTHDKNVFRRFIQELQIYDELIAILRDQNYENSLRILVINLLKDFDSEKDVLKIFIEILTSEQENDLVIRHIKKVLGNLISFKKDYLYYILNYFIDHNEVFDDRQIRLMYEMLLNYERKFIRNRNYEQNIDIIEILINLLKETDLKIQIEENPSENLITSQRSIKEILNKTIEVIMNDFPLRNIILLLALIKRKINERQFKENLLSKIRYKFRRKFEHEFFSKSFYNVIAQIRDLEISDDLKGSIQETMREMYY